MRILMVPSWYAAKDDSLGLGGIFHYEQAKELSVRHEVAIFCPFDRSLTEDFSEGTERGILTYRSRFVPKERVRNRIRIYRAFKKAVQEFKPDIVHTHVATEAGRYMALWCSVFHIPFVVTEHSTVEISGVDRGLAHLYADFVYKRSRGNFCVSEDLQRKLSAIFPIQQFHVIYNGIILPENVRKDAKISDYRENNNTGCHMVMVAALYDEKIKGLQYLFQAIRMLKDKEQAENNKQFVTLHIVGGGEYQQHFEKMARDMEIEDRVIFHGMCDKQKVYEIVSQMDFLVSASLVESFGCSIAEALLLGKPVLATRCGGPEGFVTNQVGRLVEKGSAEALYNGILEMIQCLDSFQKQDIQKYAYERFDNRVICRKYEKEYQKVLETEISLSLFQQLSFLFHYYGEWQVRKFYYRVKKVKLESKRYAGTIVLPDEIGNEKLRENIERGLPFMAARFGRTELLSVDEVLRSLCMHKKYDYNRLHDLNYNAGFTGKDAVSYKRFAKVMLNATGCMDFVGVWYNQMENWMCEHYMPAEKTLTRREVYDFWNYERPFTAALRGKKVVVIHPYTESIEQQYARREKLFENPNVLPEFVLRTVQAVQTVGDQNDERFATWFDALEYMYEEAMKEDFDIALIGCGAYGFPLAAKIKRAGKIAIHMGGVLQILFGIKGRRWDELPDAAALYNEYWVRPNENETVAKNRQVENSCYW